MDNKTKAAYLVMEFLPIVGQDPYTGIKTAKECAVAATRIAKKISEEIGYDESNTVDNYDYDEVITHIEAF